MKSKIQATEMRVFTLIKGVTYRDRMRHADRRDELNVETILHFIERTQLMWHGHVTGMNRIPPKYYK